MPSAYPKDEVFLNFAHLDVVLLLLLISGEYRVLGLDHLAQLKSVFINERGSAHGYLISEDTKSPPVDDHSMTLPLEDLGGQILRSAAERARLVVARVFDITGEPEIRKASIAFLV